MNAHRLTAPFWNIQFSNSTVRSVVSAIDSLPGFTFLSALKNYTELTIDQVSENLNMSTIQCQFDIRFANEPEAGSGKIKVLLGSLPTISCKPHLCTSVNSSKAEIPCEVSGTPIPSTKIELNSVGTSVPDDSSQFSIHRADSLMPILTIDPVNCTLDAGNNYRISSENILGTSLPYQWNDAHVLDNDDLSDCQVIDNTTRLTCSFSLARFPTANIVWNINSNNIINETSDIDVCACRVTSTVFVSLQHVSASTSCTALYNNDMMTRYSFKRCESTLMSPVTSIPTSGTSLTNTLHGLGSTDLPDVVSVVSQNRFVSTEIGCQFASIQPTSTTDITGYLVRLTNAHKQSELELSLSSNNNLFLDELEENTAYTVEIRGRNRHGLGPTSSIYVFQTTSCTDEKTNLRLTAAVATLSALCIILLMLAAYLFYRSRHVIALGGAKESNTTEMNEQEQRHDAATYETVSDSGHQADVLTRSPLYEETSVVDSPSYGVVLDQN
ncbi:uncharacterized protein LOC134177682 [Corticium candelabrum]|uniref:uncharacterized protein LOC134177682 n=1 Tax=Corticium candelabrum TaxID=121492 RepID=UPI002E272318|nr:uncharacterized protein LOC134177682 [Corticium candelabrum]